MDSNIETLTGCLRPCRYTDYELQLIDFRPSTLPGSEWRVTRHREDGRPIRAAVQFFFLDTMTDVEEEFWAFDSYSLVGEVGGALGLFLGWSALQLMEDAGLFCMGAVQAMVQGPVAIKHSAKA